MSDQANHKTDPDLIYFFKHFEEILALEKSIDIETLSSRDDFQVFSGYLISDTKEMQKRLVGANDKYLLYVCEHTFNIIEWIRLMVDARSQTFGEAIEQVFEKNFSDKHILQTLYNECFSKWIPNKSGQHKLGENVYSVHDCKLYYRDRFSNWYQVDHTTAFDIKPSKELFTNNEIVGLLNSEYKDAWYDIIIQQWEDKQYQGVLPADFLDFDKKETSPEAYFDFSMERIMTLLKNPVSIAELERWTGGQITNLEDIVKTSALALKIVKKLRRDNSHTIYLLRDSMLFYELHKTIDAIYSEETSSGQLLIGRKLLSNKPDQWGYYIVMLEALYNAHLNHYENFDDFYSEFARLLDLLVSLNSDFANKIDELALYISKHIQTDKDKIVIFDIGFQGSINLLVKYVIDYHIKPHGPNGKIETDIKVAIGALWSKELFGERYGSFYFPYINSVQFMAQSNELYHYKFGSLKDGKIRVTMGSKQWQHQAAIELVVFVMITLSSNTMAQEYRARISEY